MWKLNGEVLQWRGMVQTHPLERVDELRAQLEGALLKAGWHEVRRPWMSRGDFMVQYRDQRVLIDDAGVFLYLRDDDIWRRIAGFAGFEKPIIERGFQAMRLARLNQEAG